MFMHKDHDGYTMMDYISQIADIALRYRFLEFVTKIIQIARLNATLDLDLSIRNPGSRKLASNLDVILERYPVEDQSIIRDILYHTVYVDDIQFDQQMQLALDTFIVKMQAAKTKFYLLLPLDKIGSEHWIMHRYWRKLSALSEAIISFLDPYDKTSFYTNPNLQDSHIIIIDDAIYSGTNIMGKIDQLIYDWTHKQDSSLNCTFHVIAAYATKSGLDNIKHVSDVSESIFGQQYYNKINTHFIISSIMTPYFDGKEYPDEFARKYSIEYPVALYFDHKIANEHGSFPQFYSNNLATPITRNHLQEIAKCYQ
jgi:hypothetical protein